MPSEWYYSQGGEQHGPISEGEIRHLIQQEQLRRSDLVWCAGMDNWRAAGEIPELFPAAPAPPPAAPSAGGVPPPMAPGAPPPALRSAAAYAGPSFFQRLGPDGIVMGSSGIVLLVSLLLPWYSFDFGEFGRGGGLGIASLGGIIKFLVTAGILTSLLLQRFVAGADRVGPHLDGLHAGAAVMLALDFLSGVGMAQFYAFGYWIAMVASLGLATGAVLGLVMSMLAAARRPQ
jgi:hypothetical protein